MASRSNPFPGLRPFEIGEEYLFFGREGQSEEILRRLRQSRFLAIIGSSGSGKSSLIRAGLLPYLHSGFMAMAGAEWRVAIFRPGNDPIGNLARSLNEPSVLGIADSGEEDAARNAVLLEVTLRRSGLGLIEAVQLAGLPERENVLVVIDQFEELFRFADVGSTTRQQDDAAAFVKLLLEATRQHKLPIYVVLTMRSEFIGDCAKFRELPEAVTASPYLIPWMTRDQRRAAIEEPVRVSQAKISQRLVNRLLNDGGENPDQLPILQHALMRTWDYWESHHTDDQPIDLEHYLAVGGIDNALSLHADIAYDELSNDQSRKVAKRIFQSLTERGSDNRELRRPTTVARVAAEINADICEVISVVEHFRTPGRSLLMPPSPIKLDENAVLDISHESLIRGWQRLKTWVDEECESAKFYRRLADWATSHARGNAALWQEPDLQNALAWRETEEPNATWAERYYPDHPGFDRAMKFLDESHTRAVAAKEAEERRKSEEERRKTDELYRVRANLRIVGFVCIVALLALGVAIYYGYRSRQLTARMRENQNQTMGIIHQALVVFDRRTREEESTEDQKLNEHLLKEALVVSKQVLSEDKFNADAAMLLAISKSMLADLHRKQVVDDKERARRLLQECDHNIEEADQLAQKADAYLDLTMSTLLFASIADTLQLNGDPVKAKDIARRAVNSAQLVVNQIPSDEGLLWKFLGASYSHALGILNGRTPKGNVGSEALGLMIDSDKYHDTGHDEALNRLRVRSEKGPNQPAKNINPEKAEFPSTTTVSSEDPRPAIILGLQEFAHLEQERKKDSEAIKTYSIAIDLAKKVLNSSAPSSELIDSALWLYADQAGLYTISADFEHAEKALDEAKQLLARLPAADRRTKYDHLAILAYLGTLHRTRAGKTNDHLDLQHQELLKALEDDKESLKIGKEYLEPGQLADQLQTISILQDNVIRDYVLLNKTDDVEREFQSRLAVIQSIVPLGSLEYNNQLGNAFQHVASVYEEAEEYSMARNWNDREITALNSRSKGTTDAVQSKNFRTLISIAYGSKSWLDLFLGEFEQAIADARQGFQLDPTQLWIRTNEAHGLLFSGQVNRAMQIYLSNAKKNLDGQTFGEAVLEDFKKFQEKQYLKMDLKHVPEIQARIKKLLSSNIQTAQGPTTGR